MTQRKFIAIVKLCEPGNDNNYNLQNDSLLFYKEGEKYKSSVEFEGIILDFSENDNIMTLEMLGVSDKFYVSK